VNKVILLQKHQTSSGSCLNSSIIPR